MAKEIIDIYVEQGYPYVFNIDFNTVDGSDLENDYVVTFYNEEVGNKTFNVIQNEFGATLELTLTSEDTGKITSNLSNYVVSAVENATSEKSKLLSGRIILDKKVSI